MDTTAEKDRVVPLPVPSPDVDNPLPIVLSKDGTVVLSYVSWVGHIHAHVLVTFHVAFDHRLGAPDRRAIAAHPLAARGLKPDGAFEVKDSSWASAAGKGKHYVFTFKDAAFECLAEGYGTETTDEPGDVVRLMARRLYK